MCNLARSHVISYLLTPSLLGVECSGVVIAVGPDVKNFVLGDKVMCIASACLGNVAELDHHQTFKVPEHLTMAQASSVLSVYLAAYYALIYLARVRKGMSVLVHSGMGGVVLLFCYQLNDISGLMLSNRVKQPLALPVTSDSMCMQQQALKRSAPSCWKWVARECMIRTACTGPLSFSVIRMGKA